MTNFIANNWLGIIGVLGAIIVGLVITLMVMDSKDKKLVAEYKASIKSSKAEVVEQDDKDEEVEEPADDTIDEETKKATPAKRATAKKSTTTKKSN